MEEEDISKLYGKHVNEMLKKSVAQHKSEFRELYKTMDYLKKDAEA